MSYPDQTVCLNRRSFPIVACPPSHDERNGSGSIPASLQGQSHASFRPEKPHTNKLVPATLVICVVWLFVPVSNEIRPNWSVSDQQHPEPIISENSSQAEMVLDDRKRPSGACGLVLQTHSNTLPPV